MAEPTLFAVEQRTQTARHLLAELTKLSATIRKRAAELRNGWALPEDTPDDVAFSLGNMADWLALRRHDLTQLQPGLAGLGLSTLGRSESHVMAQLDAVLAALADIAREAAPPKSR